MKFPIGVYFLLIPFCSGQFPERIRTMGAMGNKVVSDVVDKLATKGIFSNKHLLRKLAIIQSKDDVPFKPHSGGLWRIDIDQLSSVKTSCQQNLRDLCKLFEKEFNINVRSINFPDLDKPLYSGSIMSLYLSSLNESIPEKSFQDEDFWRKLISKSVLRNDDEELTPEVFTKDNLLYKQYLKTICRERTDGVHAKTLPHPDPRMYIQCLKSSDYYVKRCPHGTFWVQKKLTCVHREDDTETTQKDKNVVPKKTRPAMKMPALKSFANPCTKETFDNGRLYFPHSDPTKYIQCVDIGSYIVKDCIPGNSWLQNETMCLNTSEHLRQKYRSLIFKTTLHDNSGKTTLNPLVNIFKHLCTKAAIAAKRLYYSHPDPKKYVKCTGVGLYIIRRCDSGKFWSKKGDTCIHNYYPSTQYLPTRRHLTNIYGSTIYSSNKQDNPFNRPATLPMTTMKEKLHHTASLSGRSKIPMHYTTARSLPKKTQKSRDQPPNKPRYTTSKMSTDIPIATAKATPTYHSKPANKPNTKAMKHYTERMVMTRKSKFDRYFNKFDGSFCTKENIAAGLKYFAHRYPTMYFECIAPGKFVRRDCPKLFFWSQPDKKCIPPRITLPRIKPTTTATTTSITTPAFSTSQVNQRTSRMTLPPRFKNPCTKKAIAANRFLFRHPNPRMFILCTSRGNYYIKRCGNDAVWFQPNRTCLYMSKDLSTKPTKTTTFKPSPKHGTVKRASSNTFETYCTKENLESHRQYFPHPEPNKFILCTNPGSYIIKECHRQALWSQANLTCVREEQMSTPKTTTVKSTVSTTVKTPTLKVYNPSLLNKIKNPCTREKIAANVMFFAHPDPQYYVQCTTHGTYFVKSCDNGTLWSQANQTCIHRYSHHSIIQNEYGGMNTGKSLCTAEALEAGTGYFAHSDPKKFIQCTVPGSYVLRNCSPGTVWNQHEMDCVFGASIHHVLTSQLPETTSKDNGDEVVWGNSPHSNPCTRELFKARFAHPDPTKYIQCSNWYNFVTLKCSPGKVWSQQLYNCI
uniref:Chitin-binding type-2 domain-containing protein n=3 Tax=Octopus bimaculoides TaxID=37653 RepID=A0A0L8GW19_OCTBM